MVSSTEFAERFGNLKIFFPFDGYKYIWSPQIRDFYEHLYWEYGEYGNATPEWFDKKTPVGALRKLDKKEFYGVLDKITNSYISSNLDDAIFKEHEVIFRCKHYYIMDFNFAMKSRKTMTNFIIQLSGEI